jgi:hypothetical protein
MVNGTDEVTRLNVISPYAALSSSDAVTFKIQRQSFESTNWIQSEMLVIFIPYCGLTFGEEVERNRLDRIHVLVREFAVLIRC